ncbi:hypothetical protein Zmor_013714 [Zophobas morio]|uniref:Pre-mRNA-splicing factor CWC25-like protein n=1 Tax=Zophobas morio TaxID=2755281 RepID=A0AA38MFB6_9CUCU|nr:hypothetical protein Zmor_013714 [Zophobas morio]
MFNQNNEEEKKLDWMYKGPNSTVSREEYLLGRPVDKTLEQLNDEEKEKQKQQSLLPVPKNRVEHECIPPSIRDFNKLVQAEQVDLSTKLQEDPLVAIKKREEETRRQFLQNPVQLKKLQKALKAQQAKKKKKKKKKSKQSSDSDSDLDQKLAEKLLGKKSKKVSKKERQLDTILIHKFEALKDKLSESDLQDILSGQFTDCDDSSEEEKVKKSRKKREESSDESEEERKERRHRNVDRNKSKKRRDSSDEDNSKKKKSKGRERSKVNDRDKERRRNTGRNKSRSRSPPNKSSSESEPESRHRHSRHFDSDDSDSSKNRKMSYGLVSSDGKSIPLSRKLSSDKQDVKDKATKTKETTPPIQKRKAHKLTEEEKEKLRQQMMENAVWRDKERVHNVRKYREREEKEKKEQSFDPDFIHKQLLKSADSSSVESRIKSNLNKIQRSSRDMDRHFSRR